MNNLAIEKTMTVKEVAEILGVTPEAVKKHVRVIFPESIQNGKPTFLNEYQVTEIKRKMIPTTQVVAAQTRLDEIEIIAKAMEILTRSKDELQKQLLEAKPKIDFFDQVTNSKDAIDIGSAAKVLHYQGGRNKLFSFLRNAGILMQNNQPYQQYIDRGYFRTIEQKFTTPDGSTHINIKTVVYQKGLNYISKIITQEKS